MCGIVGYIGHQHPASLLLEGLKRLEYRGYDSAGIAVFHNGVIKICRCEGKIARLEKLVAAETFDGCLGIGHTRWATHGRPSETNAHPHACDGIAIVHNGIIENYLELKAMLTAEGSCFASETDSEVLFAIAEATRKSGDRVRAEKILEYLVATYPDSPYAASAKEKLPSTPATKTPQETKSALP